MIQDTGEKVQKKDSWGNKCKLYCRERTRRVWPGDGGNTCFVWKQRRMTRKGKYSKSDEKSLAEDVRLKALETVAETKKRKTECAPDVACGSGIRNKRKA